MNNNLCQETGLRINSLCSYSQCLKKNDKVALDCQKCLFNKHNHDQNKLDHIIDIQIVNK